MVLGVTHGRLEDLLFLDIPDLDLGGEIMLNKLERVRVQMARDALDKAWSINGETLHEHVTRQYAIRRANIILKKLMNGEYSSKNY